MAPAVAAMIVALFLLGGLVIDGARQLNATATAQSYAEETARIMGQAVDFNRAQFVLDKQEGRADAEAYCAELMQNDGRVTNCSFGARGTEVEVTVDMTIKTGLLGLINVDEMHSTGVARAVAEIGVTEAEQGDSNPNADIPTDPIDPAKVPPDVKEAPEDPACETFGQVWEDPKPNQVDEIPFYFINPRDIFSVPHGCETPPVCPREQDRFEKGTPDEQISPMFDQCPDGLLFEQKEPVPPKCRKPPKPDSCPGPPPPGSRSGGGSQQ